MKVCKTATTLHLSLPPKIISEWTLFPKEHRSNGAKIRNRPSDSSNAKSNPVHSHHLSFLFHTKWVRRTSEPRRGGQDRNPGGGQWGQLGQEQRQRTCLGLGPDVPPLPFLTKEKFLKSALRSYELQHAMEAKRDKVTGLSHRAA